MPYDEQPPPAEPAAPRPAAQPPAALPPDRGFAAMAARSPDVLASDPGGERAPRPGRWWLVGVVAVLVAALVAGVTYGVSWLSGGGSQPEDALPAGAVAFAKVDLDPPAGQKLDAVRFLRKFPSLRGRIGVDADLREVVFDAVADQVGWAGRVDYAKDVEPWLGKRLAVAAYPSAGGGGGAEPLVVAALQVTDEGAARDGLTRLVAATADGIEGVGPRPGFVIAGDYALITQTQQEATRAVHDAADGSLADDQDFAADLAGLGDAIASVWVDGDATGEALSAGPGLLSGGLVGGGLAGLGGGRSTYALRFAGPDVLELTGRVRGADQLATRTSAVQGLGQLPADTVVGVGLADGAALVPDVWGNLRTSFGRLSGTAEEGFDEAVAQAERETGLELPEDLAVLLGQNLLVALDRDGLTEARPELGARVSTDGVRAGQVLDRLDAALAASGALGEERLYRRQTADGYVVGSSAATVQRLGQQGTLGEDEVFESALPDLSGAGFAAWVDVAALVDGLGASDEDLAGEDLARLAGVGVSVELPGGGSATFRARLVVR